MKTHALSAARPALSGAALAPPLSRLARFALDRFLLVPAGALIALVWANTAGESYFRFAHALAFPVNEMAMAIFLALITQEVLEATMAGGSLHTWRRWTTPIIAAAGGFAGAALVFLGYVYWTHEQILWQAWPVACAVDIAAAYYLVKLIDQHHRVQAFVLLLGIATNAAGLLVMMAWPTLTPGHLAGAALLVLGIGTAAALRRARIRSFWPYFAISGTLAWVGFYLADVHPALALVPIVPFMPHEPRRLDIFAEPADDDPVHHQEHRWNEAAQLAVFLFALVNAGVLLRNYDTGTWAILAAALIGRPVGILLAVAIAVTAGLHLPRGIGWRQLAVVALATSSGFTLALFFASGLLPLGAVLQQVKVGALATTGGALAAVAAAWLLGVGRFARHRSTHPGGIRGLSSETRRAR